MRSRVFSVLIVAALAMPLIGCWKEQQAAADECLAKNPFHAKWPAAAQVKTPMTQCMDQKGYRMAFDSGHCRAVAWPRRSPYCYAPKGFFAGLGFQIEMNFLPEPKPPGGSEP